ncbi:MAG: hypothetical protein ABFD54_02095 [Armatimonadota bacterium]|nr:hypothetical protein [bacterium]
MADKEWIAKQMSKAISAEESLLETEKHHREQMQTGEVAAVYDRLIKDDEKHLNTLKQIGEKYGTKGGGVMEAAGDVLAGVKSTAETVATSDPFQAVGQDLMMKSNALNYDIAWTRIFREVGDSESATLIDEATAEDEEHERIMRDTLTGIGIVEAVG